MKTKYYYYYIQQAAERSNISVSSRVLLCTNEFLHNILFSENEITHFFFIKPAGNVGRAELIDEKKFFKAFRVRCDDVV